MVDNSMIKLKKVAVAAFFIAFFSLSLSSCTYLKGKLATLNRPGKPVTVAAAVATAHPEATRAAMDILQQGGNAFDAAIAASAALAVVEPYGSGLGGGGFFLLHRASDNTDIMLDAREKAPLAATRDMYLDKNKAVIPKASLNGPLAAGIPGIPAAFAHLARNYGRLDLKDSLQPAIDLAIEGFEVNAHYQRLARFRNRAIAGVAREVFLPGGEVPQPGVKILQPDLGHTLLKIAETNAADFYTGDIATRMVEDVQKNGGIWSSEDLAQYSVVEREPVRGEYRGSTLVSASPPSSGGIVLIEMLNILSGFDLPNASAAQTVHLNVEAMRRAYRDRAEFLGDPDFVEINVKKLLSKEYADELRASIETYATPNNHLMPVIQPEGRNTTHFSIMDKDGNAVAATLSINYPFGSGFMPAKTGVLLNNEMDDFSIKPGEPNVYGLVGGDANAIEPGKRPLSSMTPTFIKNQHGFLALGTPGGSRIITMVLLAAEDFMHGEGEPQDWVAKPRYHHQYLPDEIQFEPDALNADVQQELKYRGHELKELPRRYGNMQAVIREESGKLKAASDPRGEGLALVQEP